MKENKNNEQRKENYEKIKGEVDRKEIVRQAGNYLKKKNEKEMKNKFLVQIQYLKSKRGSSGQLLLWGVAARHTLSFFWVVLGCCCCSSVLNLS